MQNNVVPPNIATGIGSLFAEDSSNPLFPLLLQRAVGLGETSQPWHAISLLIRDMLLDVELAALRAVNQQIVLKEASDHEAIVLGQI